MVRVEEIGHHHYMETPWERRLRLYKGDQLACVFGNRYATDVYEGRVLGWKKLHMLTGSGVIGTVVSRHGNVGRPTALSFLGYLADAAGERVNLKKLCFRPSATQAPAGTIVVLGTGMSTGKTTVTRQILRALVSRGVRVAGCKLTGTASPRDLYDMRATGAVLATDFSDYGFPSTSGASLDELIQLFDSMLDACSRKDSHLVVVEVADGLLQRETQMLLESQEFRRRVAGVVLAGACSASALYGVHYIQSTGLDLWALSGLITNSPLFVQEFSSRSSIPVISSRVDGDWADILMKRIAPRNPEESWFETAAKVDC
jgi:dethiobiotin synthetase